MTTTPTRDQLAESIRTAHRPDCGWCRSGDRTCPEHAAEAVEPLFRSETAMVPRADVIEFLNVSANQADLGGYEPNETAKLLRVMAQLVASGADLAEESRVIRDQTREEQAAWLRRVKRMVRSAESTSAESSGAES